MKNRIRKPMAPASANPRQEPLETLEHGDRWLWQLYKNWNLSPPEYTAVTVDLKSRQRENSGV